MLHLSTCAAEGASGDGNDQQDIENKKKQQEADAEAEIKRQKADMEINKSI